MSSYDQGSKQQMKNLLDKWNNTYGELEKTHHSKKEYFYNKIQNLSDLIDKEGGLDDQKFNAFRDQISKLTNFIGQEKQQWESKEDEISSIISGMQQELAIILEESEQNVQKYEATLAMTIEQSFDSQTNAAKKLSKSNDISKDSRFKEIGESFANLEQIIEQNKQKRLESYDAISEELSSEIQNFKEAILSDRMVRDDNHKKIFEYIENIGGQIKQEIRVEKKDRENTTEHILKVLEDTCVKIDRQYNY